MATANIKAVITAEDKASGTLKGFSNNVESMGSKIASAMKVAAAAIIAATSATLVLGIKTAASLETAEQGFKTLLGSAESAGKIMERIKREAKRTPFEITGLTQATQLLSSVTKDGDRALDFVLDIGEGLAAMGRGQAELDRISVNLQQIAATGRAFGIDIRQFAFAGIPIYEMLQEEIGLTGEALQTFIEGGGVTFDMLEKMFAKATDAGGRWAGAFENQSGTFNQLVSNMKDSFSIFASDLVNKSGAFDVVKDAIRGLTGVMSGNNETVNQWRENIAKVVTVIGSYLQPHLQALWNNIRDDLMPTFQRFWKEILEPMIPVLGVLLVAAIRGVINALNILVDIQEFFMDQIIRVKDTAVTQWNIMADGVNIIKNAISSVRDWFNNLPDWIRTALTAVTAIITAPFTAAFKVIIDGINEVKRRVSDIGGGAANLGQRILDPLGIFRAAGGPVSGGSPYIVGEQGPELFVPGQGGSIVPNHQMGGGGTVNITIQAGAFMGSDIEARKFAKSILIHMKDLAGSKNMTVSQLMGA